MNRSFATLAVAASLVGVACGARPVTYALGAETTPPAELAGADAEVVRNNCTACHSLDYIVTQPRGKGDQFWRDAVNKMITVYKAPVEQPDANKVAEILAKKFG
ncbi:MAG: cytochrome C [Sphingobium sp.]|nr:cytochrome C [Sphingobium sp.]